MRSGVATGGTPRCAVLLSEVPATRTSGTARRRWPPVMSMCVRYAGDSYTYLLDSVATDHGRAAGSPMTHYYTVAGTPPGTWLGAGLGGLADSRGLEPGSTVTPAQMARLFADGMDPVTGSALGRSPHVYAKGADRRRPVAGFDCTFTVAKSVSVLWALADDPTRDAIYAAHRRAIADVLAIIERDVARTRIGANGVAQVETRGVIAAAFDHWDSRDNDPNLHTHVVIANRVQGPDGRWRTLDSRAVHSAAVAMSERYDALLADHLATSLGLEWEYRERGPRRNPAYELAAVPQPLIAEFSQRSARIDAETDRLIAAYLAAHGRQPDPAMVIRLRQQATLATRAVKEVHPLADLTEDWRQRAGHVLRRDPLEWAAGAMARPHIDAAVQPGAEVLTAAIPPEILDKVVKEAATATLAALSRKRSTWTPWNAQAEASRALRPHRFPTAEARDQATARVVAEVAARSVLLTPPEVATVPDDLRRPDGTSPFRVTNSERYASSELLAAESRLLTAARDRRGPTARVTAGAGLFDDQASAVAAIAGSGRVLDVLVGPAGSGKTRTLAALRALWEAEHGSGSLVGLAPSAAAAVVLADSLGIPTENTAKWLAEHDREPDRLHRIDRLRAAVAAAPDPTTARALAQEARATDVEVQRWRFRPGQLVIIDEASLAATLDLDRIAACAAEAGAKLVLVGDWAQLSSVEAGGAFGLLVRDRGASAPELGAARRFVHEWEREASTRLRVGHPAAIDAYAAHARISEGDQSAMVEAAWAGWVEDEHAGRRSLMIAADRATVRDLNERGRAERIAAGLVSEPGAPLHDGLAAGVGDRVVTRRNDRRLGAGSRWVKNGDIWIVTDVTTDGGLTVQRPGGGPAVWLPARYVAEHVELGYATTAHRAQGATVDTAHAVVAGIGTTREVLYVMLTRAREANHVYVATDREVESLTGFTDEAPTGRGLLLAALATTGAAVSAHEVADAERETAASIRTLAAEYETLAGIAQAPRWAAALAGAGLSEAAVAEAEASPAYGALSNALRRADAHQLLVEAALPRLAAGITAGSRDPAAVLHARVDAWTAAAIRTGRAAPLDAVVGLLPAVRMLASSGPAGEIRSGAAGRAPVEVPADVAEALHDRRVLIEQRVDQLLDRAARADAPWLASLGPRPTGPISALAWETARRAVAAYRDRYSVATSDTLGPVVDGDTQRDDARSRCVQAIAAVRPDAIPPAERSAQPGGKSTRTRLSTDPITPPSRDPAAASL
jgi:conjugative relaxase-like TrwC/TraI family protein